MIITATIAAISAAIFFIRRRLQNRYAAFALALLLVSMTVLSLTAYAKPFPTECDEYGEECTDGAAPYHAETGITITIPALPIDTEPEEEPEPEPEPTREPQTLTPPGNMTLVDDFSGESADDKQFITVVTRNGHFFYIVIDRAGDRQNVHFLNQVDEYSLWAILDEDAPRPTTPMPEPMPEVIPDPEPIEEPEVEQGGGAGGVIILLVLLAAIGGGAYYYFKVLKPGQAAKGGAASQLDEFVFDEDEDDFDGGMDEYSGAGDSTVSAEDIDDMPDFSAADFGDETPESEDRN